MQKNNSRSNISRRGWRILLRKVFVVTVVAALTICFFVIALEVGLGILLRGGPPLTWDPILVPSDIEGLGYRLAPNFHKDDIRTDREGLLWRPPDSESPLRKVLIIGDSVAFGSDVLRDQNFSVLLEQKLRDSFDAPIAVWNAGTPGYNTTQEAILLRVIGPRLNPDLLIVQLCLNDHEPALFLNARNVLERKEGVESTDDESGFLSGLFPPEKAIIFLKHKIKSLQKTYPEWFPVWAHYIHYVGKKPGWKESKESLLAIRDWTNGRNIAFLLVLFPFEQQLRIRDAAPQKEIADFAKAEGIHYFDLYSSFEERWRDQLFIEYSEMYHMADKVHLSPSGHALAAQEIAAVILGDSDYYLKLPQ
jgi:lysophospholipase L1-like esterase